jgi:hypothetical protein
MKCACAQRGRISAFSTYFVGTTLAVAQKIVCNVAMDEGKKYEIIVKVHTTNHPEQ